MEDKLFPEGVCTDVGRIYIDRELRQVKIESIDEPYNYIILSEEALKCIFIFEPDFDADELFAV